MCRCMVLLMVVIMAPWLMAEEWSGTFEVVETLTGVTPSGEAKRDVDNAVRVLEERVARTREALKTANPALAKALKQDLAALAVELESLALERGGTVTIGLTSYVVAAGRIVVDGDEGRVVADANNGSAVVAIEGRRQTVALVKPGQSIAPRDAAAANALVGVDTMRGTITVEGQPVAVQWAPSLPNVYALTLLSSHSDKGLHAQLATLPGLPMQVERPNPRGGTMCWTVQRLIPGPVDPKLLVP